MATRFVIAILLGGAILSLTSAQPGPDRQDKSYSRDRHSIRSERHRREGESRDCEATPPYLPPTTIETGVQLGKLREALAANNLTAYIIPSEDAHQSEYIADRDKRRQYMTGFSGSSGLAIVTTDEAALWTDSRYWLQADMELDCNWQLMKSNEPGVPSPEDWLVETLQPGENVGFDATLMSVSGFNTYTVAFESSPDGAPVMMPINSNLIDEIWSTDVDNPQPPYPDKGLLILDANTYTGETWQQKIWAFPGTNSIRGKMTAAGTDALVVTKLDEIAWTFNLRGKDIPYNPMFVSYAIITTSTIQLYLYDMDTRLTDEIKSHLGTTGCREDNGEQCVMVKQYEEFLPDLTALTSDMVWISDRSSYAVHLSIPETKRYVKASPILLMKAVKSDMEIAGMNNAHLKDSVALCQLGAWMQDTVDNLKDPVMGDINILSELIVEQKAEEFRSGQDDFEGLSFRSISGFGPHGALNHYSSSNDTNVPITTTSTFLFDSGSQYRDGSCDITRTFHFGTPTAFMKEAYTRVLLGHIDLALGTFRTGIYGRDIDSLAREPLWRGGLDFKHGTGHGVGHYLNIHEDPINIANYPGEEPVDINVCVSDEPGYYQDGEFGIRIEDVMCSIEADTKHHFNNASYTYMTWKMASLVPLEPVLIDFDMFSNRQFDWYNAYNQRIRDEVGPLLRDLDDRNAAYHWMMSKTTIMRYSFRIGKTSGSDDDASVALVVGLVIGGVVLLVAIMAGVYIGFGNKRGGGNITV